MIKAEEGFGKDFFGVVGEEAKVMFRLFYGVGELRASMFYAVIVFTEVTGLHYLVEEELTFFLIWWADEVFIRHGENGLKNVHYSPCKLLHSKTPESMHDFLVGFHRSAHSLCPLRH